MVPNATTEGLGKKEGEREKNEVQDYTSCCPSLKTMRKPGFLKNFSANAIWQIVF